MGLRTWWTEERFEKWFQARFNRWINERFDAELDQQLQARDAAVGSKFQDRFDSLFDARFETALHGRIKTWQDSGLPGFDTWVENFFDTLFTVYANTWGDGAGFQERFDRRFDERLHALFEERLNNAVTARVANEINTQIDRRIEAWLVAVRQDLLDAAPPAASQLDDPSPEVPASGTPGKDRDVVETATAAQLAAYLRKGPLQPQRIRQLLKGREVSGRKPHAYPLGDAAATLLLRKGRPKKEQGKAES